MTIRLFCLAKKILWQKGVSAFEIVVQLAPLHLLFRKQLALHRLLHKQSVPQREIYARALFLYAQYVLIKIYITSYNNNY